MLSEFKQFTFKMKYIIYTISRTNRNENEKIGDFTFKVYYIHTNNINFIFIYAITLVRIILYETCDWDCFRLFDLS